MRSQTITQANFDKLWWRVNIMLAGFGRHQATRGEMQTAFDLHSENVPQMVAAIIAIRDNPHLALPNL